MTADELRQEAVRRRLAGETLAEIARALDRTTRWVRKWVGRHGEEGHDADWAASHSRAPRHSPNRTGDEVRAQILTARERLVANPRAQYGSLRSSGSCAVSEWIRSRVRGPLSGSWPRRG